MILLDNLFTIKNGVVHWGRHPITQADPGTFQHLGGDWARDARHIFVQAKPKKIDVSTFQFLNPVYVKDANNAYDWERAIKGADAATFEVRFTVVNADTTASLASDCKRFFDTDQPIDEQEFWNQVSENLAGLEKGFRTSYHRIRNTCTTYNGSGDCYCKRKGDAERASCARCNGNGKCHVCKGEGRVLV